jgi:MFS family permease
MKEEESSSVAHAGEDLVAQREPVAVRLTALLLSVGIMVVGNGLAGTLLGVRAGLEGMRAESIGLLMSAYFLGFALGSYFSPRLIALVGHIRTFAALASIASAVALSYAILVSPPAWTVLRIAHGACYAGMTVVVESWLNGTTRRRSRGKVLATYNVVLLAAWAGSQPLLTVADESGFVLFCVVSICLSLALVPITLTRSGVPGVAQASRSGLRRLYEISPVGIAGALITGLATGAFYGMGPMFAQRMGFNDLEIALFMGATILGALVLQWPLGWLSDLIDRRLVIIGSGILSTATTGVAAISVPEGTSQLLFAFMFVYGGTMIPLYALSVAHVNDNIDSQELVAAASGLVMVYGVGASIGPFAASQIISRVGPEGLFLFSSCALATFVTFALVRLSQGPAVAPEIKQELVVAPRTSHAALQMHEHRTGPSPGPREPA